MKKIFMSLIVICFMMNSLLVLKAKGEEAAGFTFNGFVDAAYFYDNNAESNTFSLDQAEIDVTKEIKDWASLRADINYVNTGSHLTTDDILEQGYLTLTAPIGNGLTFTFGKFNAPIGFELLDPVDMYQYSHALVFDNGLPTNLTGLMASTSFADIVDLNLYVVNGWDNISDTNKGKTVGGRVGITPIEGVNFGISTITGPEGANEGDKRSVLDIDAAITIIPNHIIGAEINLGWEDNASGVTSGEDAEWFGFLLMTHYDYAKWGGITIRYDYFDDKDGARLGSGKQKQQAITLCPTFVIADGFGALLEYRYDFSNERVFDITNGPKYSDSTLAFEMTYSF